MKNFKTKMIKIKNEKFPIIAKYFFEIALLLTLFQQLPIIFERYYSSIRVFLYFILIIVLVLTLMVKPTIPSNPLFYIFTFVILFALIIDISLFFTTKRTSQFTLLMIPLAILIIAPKIYDNEKQLTWFITFYAIATIFVMLLVTLYYNKGFSISGTYTIPGKNYNGVSLSNAVLILLALAIKQKNLVKQGLFILLALFGVFLLLVIRNRSSLVGLALLAVIASVYILFSKHYVIRRYLLVFGFIGLLAIVAIPQIRDFIFKSLLADKNLTSLNSISANRITQYIDAWSSFLKYPLFGTSFRPEIIPFDPHNYIFYILYNYGIIIGIPFILLYVSLYVLLLSIILKKENSLISILVVMLLFVNLFVSNVEYTYPYGPGTAQIIMWVFIGLYLTPTFNRIKHEQI